MSIDRRYSVAEGQGTKTPCIVATTANITLSGEQTIDGVAVADTSPPTRVLVKNQSNAVLNGIYDVSTGNWTRSRDFDGAFDIVTGTRVYVTSGTVGAQLEYAVSTAGSITIDTSSINFVIMGGSTAPVSAAMKPVVVASTIDIARTLLGITGTGIDTNVLHSVTADYTIAAADAGKLIQAGTGTSGLFTLTLPAVSGFDTTAVVTIKNGDTTRGKRMIGFPSDVQSILWPLQSIQLRIINGAWATVFNPGRWRTPGIADFYVDTAGSNTNDGLATGAGAFRTLAFASQTMYQQIDFGGATSPTVHVTAGQTFNEQVFAGGQLTGNNVMTFKGNGGNFIWANNGPCCSLGDNGEVIFDGVTWQGNQSNTNGTGHILSHNNGIFDLTGSHIFVGNGANDCAIFMDGPSCGSVSNGFTLAGQFGDAVHFDAGGKLSLSGIITPSGSPTVARLFNLKYCAVLLMGTQPDTVGYGSIGASLVASNSVLQRNGVTIPGGAITATTGGQLI